MRGHNRAGSAIFRARRLRRDSTDVERLLWGGLRNGRLSAFKFRRQHPIGRYVVDLVCVSGRLVIEADGAHHAPDEGADAMRTQHLEALGFRVLRFTNTEILASLEGVLETILDELRPHG